MKIGFAFSLLASALLVASASPASVLPIRISVDRCHDTQWSPPGHPALNVSFLLPPNFDLKWQCRAGYYTFETNENGNITSFVRIFEDDSGASVVLGIFETVDFLVVSDDVLFFNGNPNNSTQGGGYGTLIQGSNIPASDSDASYSTVPVEESGTTPTEWLLQNFRESEESAVCPESEDSAAIPGSEDTDGESSAASRVDAFLWKMLVALVLLVAVKG